MLPGSAFPAIVHSCSLEEYLGLIAEWLHIIVFFNKMGGHVVDLDSIAVWTGDYIINTIEGKIGDGIATGNLSFGPESHREADHTKYTIHPPKGDNIVNTNWKQCKANMKSQSYANKL